MDEPLLPEEHDACLRFSLGGEVTLNLLQDALGRFSGVLDALRERHAANVDWMVAGLDYGSVSTAVRAVPLDNSASPRIAAMCDEYLDAAVSIQSGDVDFTLPLHQQMYKLLRLADEAHPVVVATDGQRVEIETPISLDGLGGPKRYKTLGTLRGRVETLSRHNKLNFRLYELHTGVPVTCYMGPDDEATMRDVWGYTAEVTGTISRDINTDKPLTMRSITKVQPVDEGEPGRMAQGERCAAKRYAC